MQRKASAALAALQASAASAHEGSLLPRTLGSLPRALSLPGLGPLTRKAPAGSLTGNVRRALPREHQLTTPGARPVMRGVSTTGNWPPPGSPGFSHSKSMRPPLFGSELEAELHYASHGTLPPRTAPPPGSWAPSPMPRGLHETAPAAAMGGRSLAPAPSASHHKALGLLSGAGAGGDADTMTFELRDSVLELSDRIREIERVTSMLNPSYTVHLQDRLHHSFEGISRQLGSLDSTLLTEQQKRSLAAAVTICAVARGFLVRRCAQREGQGIGRASPGGKVRD